ncbi:hypothetical protein IWQ60_012167 [Tieghemiomyces parasiticus]|uniref:SHSP domain-containing protein n=1 Tax=Tieghemiomyces parasiticus TaxID=78921 RepID=A0A9W7ZLW6_9FUNG|nr:hypothetical protein IWQ60_012167 [Tieghemiomyces parasiticus]
MSGIFSDSFYQSSSMSQDVYVTGPNAHRLHPQSPPTLTSGASHAMVPTPYGQFGSHQLIPVTMSSDYCHYQRQSEPEYSAVAQPNSLSAVRSDIEYSPDMYKVTMKWDGAKPAEVQHRYADGRLHVAAAGEERVTNRVHVVYEQRDRDLMHRSFEVPEGYDAENAEVEYADGTLQARVPKKKNLLSFFF